MSSDRPLARAARWLANRCGSDVRAAEIRGYLDDSSDHGHAATLAEVGSLGLLATRVTAKRVANDLPWWVAGLPFTIYTALILAWVSEAHFPAWDFVSEGEVVWSSAARFWSRVLDVLFFVGVIAALVAGRRAVERLRRQQFLLPVGLLIAAYVSVTQTDLFIEKTPAFREGGVRSAQVNEIPFYSIGLFAGLAMVPVAFLVVDRLTDRRLPERAQSLIRVESADIDPVAITAVALPLLLPLIGFFALAGFWIAMLVSRSFSRRLKVVGALVMLGGLGALTFVGVFLVDGGDDRPAAIALLVWFGALIPIWLRMGIVAFAPLRRGQRSDSGDTLPAGG